jgi:hypothetical protein
MKVYISKYKSNWISPYTIKEKFFFWKKDYDAYENEPPKWLGALCQGVFNLREKFGPRIEYVKIDRYDTWSMDHTLALIVLPMLKQLRLEKHGIPGSFIKAGDDSNNAFDQAELEWNAVMDEMIWAFEEHCKDDGESQFYSGEHDRLTVPVEWDDKGKPTLFEWKKGPNDTFKIDMKGLKAYQKRKQKGFELFGKYYQNLWD